MSYAVRCMAHFIFIRSCMEENKTRSVVKTVCGGILTEPEKYPSMIFKDDRLYFCTRACMRVFQENPQAFLDGEVEHPLEEDV
jgi:YHS domain-containing protein